jgi:2-polyprenyl-3-methyl-5-hydroxy-6-metoxy-1,4-benzoquinol methylase
LGGLTGGDGRTPRVAVLGTHDVAVQLRRAECIDWFERHHFDTLKLFKVEYNFKIDKKESCR